LKRIIFFLAVTLLLVLNIGCQSNLSTTSSNTPPQNESSKSAEPKGKTVEKDTFFILVPEGWEVMDVDGGVQIYKMSGEVFELHFRGYNMNDTEAKQQAESMAKQYNGTEPKQIDLLGKQFWTTSFTANGVPQVTNLCMQDGVMLSVKYGGPNYESNPDFKTILDSVKLKN